MLVKSKIEITDEYLIECHNKAIRNWVNQNGLHYDELVSESNSHYFKIKRDGDEYHISVRVSNHPKRMDSMNSLEFRVDMLSKTRFDKKKTVDRIHKCLDSAIKRLDFFTLKANLELIKK